jgi:hypothetical protein
MKRWLFLLCCMLLASLALADKVPSPPDDCPPGSTGDTGHEGPHCIPLDCKTDADCKGGLVCKEQPLCIEEKMLAPRDDPEKSKFVFVYDSCEVGAKCTGASTCVTGKRCVAASAPKDPPKDPPKAPTNTSPPAAAKGGCSVSLETTGWFAWAPLLLFVLGVRIAKRRGKV